MSNPEPRGSQSVPRTAKLVRPFRHRGFWMLATAWVIVAVCGLLIARTDLKLTEGRDDQDVNLWVYGLIAILFVVTLARYVSLAVFPPPQMDRSARPLAATLFIEASAMAQYAAERGRSLRPKDVETLHELGKYFSYDSDTPIANMKSEEINRLVGAHKNLSALVAPAMPKTLAILNVDPTGGNLSDQEQRAEYFPPAFTWLGTVRLVRMMMGVAILLLPLFIGLAIVRGPDLANAEGIFDGDFVDKVATGTYLVVASALGASFAALFKARRFIENLSYDDQYESSYWMRFVLGLLAGLILSVALSNFLPTPDQGTNGETAQGAVLNISVPLLALMGGFSSDLVYRILKRVIDAIDALLQGSASEQVETERQKAELRLQGQAHKAQRAEATELVSLLGELSDTIDIAAARAAVQKRLAALLGTESEFGIGEERDHSLKEQSGTTSEAQDGAVGARAGQAVARPDPKEKD